MCIVSAAQEARSTVSRNSREYTVGFRPTIFVFAYRGDRKVSPFFINKKKKGMVMTKFQNELDIEAAQRFFARNKKKYVEYISKNKELVKTIDILEKNNSVICYIYSKSVTFRIGKSSVKTILNYPSGFKASFTAPKTSKDVFSASYQLPTAASKTDFVVLAAIWFLISHKERVKTESDATEAVESEQTLRTQETLKGLVDEYGVVKIILGNKTYEVDSFSQATGRPKADMTFNLNNNPVIFVSHKKGSGPAVFQQYGGFAGDLGISSKADAAKHPEILTFINELESVFYKLGLRQDTFGRYDFNDLEKGSNFAKMINSADVAYTVMFGKDYFTKMVGYNNCSVLIDGDIILKPVKGKGLNVFTLEGSYHTAINPALLTTSKQFSSNINDPYSPVMFIMKSESQGLNQGGFSNARAVIWPNNKVVQSYMKQFDEILTAVNTKNTRVIKEYRNKLVK